MPRMTQYSFDMRFRAKDEEEGRGSLGRQFHSTGTCSADLARQTADAVDDILRQDPDAVFDRMIFYSNPH